MLPNTFFNMLILKKEVTILRCQYNEVVSKHERKVSDRVHFL